MEILESSVFLPIELADIFDGEMFGSGGGWGVEGVAFTQSYSDRC